MIDFKLIHGDCLEEMKKMADKSVDVIITSPPYNDSGNTESDKINKRHFKYENAENRDDWYEWQCEVIDEMLRITKRHVLYNIQPILNNKADVYRLIGKYADKIDNILMWYKPNAQPQHYPHRMANFYEMVLIFKGQEFDKLFINSNGYTNVIVQNINSNRDYCEKHRALMSEAFCDELVREFVKDGEPVLDPFMGLATTGLSCIKYGKDFIGIELHKPYYDIAERRMTDTNAQINIFDYLQEAQ